MSRSLNLALCTWVLVSKTGKEAHAISKTGNEAGQAVFADFNIILNMTDDVI